MSFESKVKVINSSYYMMINTRAGICDGSPLIGPILV